MNEDDFPEILRPLTEDELPPLTEDLEELADLLAPKIDERLGVLARMRLRG